MLCENRLETPYGVFTTEFYPDGGVRAIRPGEKNVLIIHAGDLITFCGEQTPLPAQPKASALNRSAIRKRMLGFE